ncbi:SipW-dependent-type signal peptide-containing protein [Haloarchaeobius amylolyticus]|uniref:SipW-dependent-type signal peptide-containing protein n=1 Tax=Haloarchaeobius amylolyticus TaxID=1198296 RepID=A0ABD6BD69_9EURY
MSDDENRLSRRKILGSLGAIGIASAGAGFGTSAYFNDRETFDDNSLTAGELDLRLDWQQLYYGPEENTDRYAPYGDAGYPFVNAHPDHEPNGEQSLDTDELDEFANEGVVAYSDEGANIQEYLTCETLENYEVPDDFYNGVRTQDSLIELEDIKPGDCGEVTFSFHLCDNPGYVWFFGEAGEIDDELAEEILVQAWYDLDCDNDLDEDDEDRIIVNQRTSLANWLEELEGYDGYMLNPGAYGIAGVGGDDGVSSGSQCLNLGKIEWTNDGLALDDEDDGELLAVEEDTLAYVFQMEDSETGAQIILRIFELEQKTNGTTETLQSEDDFAELDVVEFDWEILEEYTVGETTYESHDLGMCQLEVKAGETIQQFDLRNGACTTGQDDFMTPDEDNRGISYTEFWYCYGEGEPGLCFPGNETFCIGFEWCLPTDASRVVDSVNDLQNTSVSFDLGFYTEQCRHNPDPTGPSSGS